MTDRYYAWVAAVSNRDAALMNFAAMSALLVLAWASVNWWPARLRGLGRFGMLMGALIAFYSALGSGLGEALMLPLVGLAAGLMGVFAFRYLFALGPNHWRVNIRIRVTRL